MKEYGFAIIGCGSIAKIHADAIGAMENARLVAVYDNFYDFAEKFAATRGVKAYRTLKELLADESVEVVCICTPSGLHAELAVAAAKAKKHIVVEKPMAITKAQIAEMIRAVEENGVKMEVVTQLRFTDAIKKTKKAIEEGRLGKILLADYRMKFYRSPEYYAQGGWRGTWKMDGGGALMNQGIHGIDLIQYLLGGVKSVRADCKTMLHDIEVEDTANILVEYNCGAIGVIQATTAVSPGYPRSIEITGTKGTVIIREDVIERWDVEGEQMETGAQIDGKACSSPMDFSYANHKLQFEDLLQAIETGGDTLVNVYEGKKPVEIILAAYESEKTGGKVVLD